LTFSVSILAAAFVTPGLFFSGAAAMSVPIIIHLLARRRFKRVRWAAVEFLLAAEKKKRRRVKLEEWILLALRCLAVLLIAMLIARPFLTPSGIIASLSGHAQTERIILIDDSFSMGYVSAGVPLFTHAKKSVRRLIALIREESPDDTVTIFRMTEPGSPMERGTFLDERQTPELLARLESLSVSQLAMDPVDVVERVSQYLSQSEDIINTAVYVVSDFQKKDWLTDAQGEASASVLKPLMGWSGDDHDLQIVLIDVGDDQASNIAVTDVRVTGGQLVTGAEATFRAKVANYSAQAANNLDVSISVGDLAQPTKTIPELAGGLTTSVDLGVSFVTAGFETVRVSVPHDSLEIDDVRHFVADVASSIRILVVNGEPSTDLFEDEVTYLSTALRPQGEVFSGNDVVVVDESALETANLSTYHAVILANVYRVSEPAAARLEQFVRRGGGVMFFLGDQVDPGLYNATLYRDGSGLLPAKLGERVRGARPFHLHIVDRLHTIMRPLSLEGDPLGLSEIPFFEFFDCKPWSADKLPTEDDRANDAEEKTDGKSDMASASPSRVLAVFRDDQDYPAIIERKFGSGRVILVTTAADKEWHLWPNHPTYLPVMMELALYVSKRSVDDAAYSAGVPIEMAIDTSMYESEVIVRTPAYPTEREAVVTAKPSENGAGLVATWPDTKRCGVYQFVLRRRDQGQTIRLVSVNPDTRESDVASANESELRQANEGVPIEYVNGVEALSGEVGNPRTELWRLVLLAAVAVLLFEQFLAWSWGRRR